MLIGGHLELAPGSAHDETFERLAKGYTIRETLSTFRAAVQQRTNEAFGSGCDDAQD